MMTLSALAIVLIPCALVFMILGFITLNRYIAYKERIALAQLGFSWQDLHYAEAEKRHGNRGVLWGGVITGMSGLALLLGLATLGAGAWLIGGLLPLFVGLGMVLIYFMTLGPAPSAPGRAIEDHDEGSCPAPSEAEGDPAAPFAAPAPREDPRP
jgi:hypothetical protein